MPQSEAYGLPEAGRDVRCNECWHVFAEEHDAPIFECPHCGEEGGLMDDPELRGDEIRIDPAIVSAASRRQRAHNILNING